MEHLEELRNAVKSAGLDALSKRYEELDQMMKKNRETCAPWEYSRWHIEKMEVLNKLEQATGEP